MLKPLFMWAGGKTKLIEEYSSRNLLPEEFDSYIEPFVCAGAMFTWAYEKNPDAQFYLNDSNRYIMAIYDAVKTDEVTFCNIVDRYQKDYLGLPGPEMQAKNAKGKTIWVPNPAGATNKEIEKKYREGRSNDWNKLWKENVGYRTRRSYYFRVRQRYQENNFQRFSTFDSATLYFLMKTGFNGIWQTKKDTDLFNTPCGTMRHKARIYDRENVMEWSKALQNVELTTGDFMETLRYAFGREKCFIFMDPPYRGSYADFGVDFDDRLQQRVVDYLNCAKHIGSDVMMSNRDVGDGFFTQRQGTNIIETFDVTYTLGAKKQKADGTYEATKAKEILMIGKK